nr:serine protease [uncultured Albidiferax sp.]
MSAVLIPQLSQDQIDDLAQLFAKALTPGTLSWLGTATLGIDVLREEGNSIGSTKELAQRLVTRLAEKGAVEAAVSLLRRESRQKGYLSLGLDEIMAGRRFHPGKVQALLNTYEPFFNSDEFQRIYPRVTCTVCAVAVQDEIKGSGFLIGPDLVLTNFHVIPSYFKASPNNPKVFEQNGDGKDLKFVFDYRSEPPPDLSGAQPAKADSTLIVHAADAWLVHARRFRDWDGEANATMPVDKEFDYAVIRLASAVGNRPSRVSGGAMRGWLPLPEVAPGYVEPRRVLVFQHPEGTSQKWDVGEFVKLDASSTRVWYSVSTAHGSSGGAAVSANGALFALHNAEVDATLTGLQGRVNQGVRIDTIAKDLVDYAPGWQAPAAADDSAVALWSLTDSIDGARPVIGRRVFRENVALMTADRGKRAMVVLGDYGTFARFTIALLQRLVGNQVPIARFTPSNMGELTPPEFVRALLEQLGVERDLADPMPTVPETEMPERWLALDLPGWVGRQLARHAKVQPGTFPAWVAIDVTAPAHAPVLWKGGLRDLVTGLVGVRDAGQAVDISELRWVLISTTPLPVGGATRLEEDLRGDLDAEDGFVECMQFAWRAIDASAPIPPNWLVGMARKAKAENSKRPAAERFPVRKALANAVTDALNYVPRR